ncbi:hypothetical protein ACFRLW_45425, partial [Streptomyces sp. NPDC056728]
TTKRPPRRSPPQIPTCRLNSADRVFGRRRVVERTFGWLMQHRRLARDYETHPHRSEAIIHVAMIGLMSRRLTGEPTPNWRDT